MLSKTSLTSYPFSKYWYISWVIDNNKWFMGETPSIMPDWFEEIKFFSIKYSTRLLYIKYL